MKAAEYYHEQITINVHASQEEEKRLRDVLEHCKQLQAEIRHLRSLKPTMFAILPASETNTVDLI